MLTNIIFHPRWRNVGSCWRPCRAGPDAWRCWGFNGPRWSQALCRHLVEPQGIACFKWMRWLSRSISNQRKKSRHANPFATNLITHAPHFVTMKSWMIIIIGLLEVTQCYVCVCVDISGPGTGGIRAATFTDAPQPLSGLFEGCTKKTKKEVCEGDENVLTLKGLRRRWWRWSLKTVFAVQLISFYVWDCFKKKKLNPNISVRMYIVRKKRLRRECWSPCNW